MLGLRVKALDFDLRFSSFRIRGLGLKLDEGFGFGVSGYDLGLRGLGLEPKP